MEPDPGPIVGIDLGTTFSSIAFLNAFGRAEVIPTSDGAKSVPSVVLFEPGNGDAVVGQQAKERSVESPDRVVEFVKREMGDPDWTFPVDGKELRPQTISGIILRKLADLAEGALQQRPTAAVITCPAYFGDLERQATEDAGRLAGLEVQAVFNEPTAAALAYGLHHAAKDERVRALVYDLGGGTFDVTVLELKGRQVQVLATAGEHRLGGKDWDDELMNYVAEEFQSEFGKDPRDELETQQDLRNRCESAKVTLSRKTKAKIFCRAFGETLKVAVSRQLFDELTRPLLEQTRTYLDEVLSRSGIGWEDLDVVLPVGGSSHMPQVKELLRGLLGRDPEKVVDPDLAVVQGATYYAALLRAEEGFEIKCFAVRQPTGRLKKVAGAEELPALPPASMEEAPELLPALPPAQPKAPPPRTKSRPAAKRRPSRRPPARKPKAPVFAMPLLPGAVGASAKKPRRPAKNEPRPKSGRPTRREPEMAGALPPMDPNFNTMAMGISLENPLEPGNTAVFDFKDVIALGELPTIEDTPASPQPKRKQRLVTQVNARSLGVLVHDKGRPKASIMIEKNTQLPAVKRSRFYTINDNQTGVKVVVLEGEDPNPEACQRIGVCVVTGLPARPKGQPVEICYSYTEDGKISIWAMDLGTGRQAEVELRRRASLDEDELRAAASYIEGVCG